MTMNANAAKLVAEDTQTVYWSACKAVANNLIPLGGLIILNTPSTYMTKVFMADGEISVQCFRKNGIRATQIIRQYSN